MSDVPGPGPDLLPVVVGVSGHRTLRPQDVAPLEASVSAIFAEMRAAWPTTPLCVLSPCAEGADRLVARVALRHGARLLVLLPMPRALYEADFSPASLAEFRSLADRPGVRCLEVPLLAGTTEEGVADPLGADRKLQYLRMGTFLARHCAVLVALWNGKPGAEVGGTAQIVAFKRSGRLELAPALRGRMEADEEPFRYRRTPLDAPETGVIHHVWTSAGDDDVPEGSVGERRLLRPDGLTSPVEVAAFDRRNVEIGARIESFNATLARAALGGEPPPAPRPELPEDLGRLHAFLERTDRAASRLQARTWRTLTLLCWSAFLAAAAFGAFAHLAERTQARAIALAAYLGFLAAAALLWVIAKGQRFQDRFQDLRAVAEGLRIQYFWRLAGLPHAAADHYLRKQRSDLDWIRHAVRYWGFATAPIQPARLDRVFDEWIEDQIRYYRARAAYHRRAAERLHACARVSLVASLALAALWGIAALAAIRAGRASAPELTGHTFEAFVVVVPLLVVASGIFHLVNEKRAHGPHARQYDRMLGFFLAARAELADPGRDSGGTLLELGKEALAENGDWVLLHRERPLEIPHGA